MMLAENETVLSSLKCFYEEDKLVASICASPLALEAAGLAAKIKGTCYPGFEQQVHFKEFSEDIVVKDGNVITSTGSSHCDIFCTSDH